MVGRNAPLVLTSGTRTGCRPCAWPSAGQGREGRAGRELRPAARRRAGELAPAQEKRFRLQEGPGSCGAAPATPPGANFFQGQTARLEQDFTARLTPPRLEVLTTQHYVNQGGCDMIVYKVTPASADSGVLVGDAFFRGFPLPGRKDPAVRFAVFAYPYDVPAGTPSACGARRGGQREPLHLLDQDLPQEIPHPGAARQRRVPQQGGAGDHEPDARRSGPGRPAQELPAINRDLRKQNNQTLARWRRSQERFLWSEPFRQLSNSQVEAQFADHRIYKYQGKEVDRQDHLGYDLATNANNPIAASNDGLVMMAEFFGIYGNTVVIDHGYGLLSLYGHMSSFAVKAGDTVTRGQTIGQSGATGLAGGDHLHFSMILQGEQVDAARVVGPALDRGPHQGQAAPVRRGAAPARQPRRAPRAPAPAAAPAARRRPERGRKSAGSGLSARTGRARQRWAKASSRACSIWRGAARRPAPAPAP